MWKGSCPAAMPSNISSVVRKGSEIVAGGVLTNDGSCRKLVEENVAGGGSEGECSSAFL